MRLILHIGHPKTGTTALQTVLAGNSQTLLERASTLYPIKSMGVEKKHALLIPWLLELENEAIQRRARCSGATLRALSHGCWRSLLDEVHAAAPDYLILSAEGFWMMRNASIEKARSIKDSLYSIASHVTVVGYLRSPAAYFASRINQKIRNFRAAPMPEANYYRDSIEAWEGVGLDEYCWRIYEPARLVHGDIVDDFCLSFLPLDRDAVALQRGGSERSNRSVSTEALVILEELPERYPSLTVPIYDSRRHEVVKILRMADEMVGGGCRPALTRHAKNAIFNRCDDLHWLHGRGLRFSDIDYSLISNARHDQPLQAFAKVSDFCVVDPGRLVELRVATKHLIEELFHLE